MATALITTLYGCVLAHVIFGPIANQLRKRDEEETLCKLIINGVWIELLDDPLPLFGVDGGHGVEQDEEAQQKGHHVAIGVHPVGAAAAGAFLFNACHSPRRGPLSMSWRFWATPPRPPPTGPTPLWRTGTCPASVLQRWPAISRTGSTGKAWTPAGWWPKAYGDGRVCVVLCIRL